MTLKPGIKLNRGDGSRENPYVVGDGDLYVKVRVCDSMSETCYDENAILVENGATWNDANVIDSLLRLHWDAGFVYSSIESVCYGTSEHEGYLNCFNNAESNLINSSSTITEAKEGYIYYIFSGV